MLVLRTQIVITCFFCLFCFPNVGLSAINFEGAIIDFKDVPTTAWKYGVLGNKMIVMMVNANSKSKQFGFKVGDIILSIDNKEVVSYKDLIDLTSGKHSVKVFNKKNEIENLIVNIVPIENINNKQKDNYSNSPAIVVNDEALANKFGKSDAKNVTKKRSYQDCMDDELANANTYEYYLNKPNSRGGDYGRAQRICDEEFGRRTRIKIERLY